MAALPNQHAVVTMTGARLSFVWTGQVGTDTAVLLQRLQSCSWQDRSQQHQAQRKGQWTT